MNGLEQSAYGNQFKVAAFYCFTPLKEETISNLLEKLMEIKSQIWVTATEKESFFQNKEKLLNKISSKLKYKKYTILTMGAGDIRDVGIQLKKRI